MRQKSAKDVAFDKERAKLNKKIKDLTRALEESKKNVAILKEENLHMDTKIAELNDWIERLLEYIDTIDDKKEAVPTISKKSDPPTNQILQEFLGVRSLLDEAFENLIGRF